MTNVSEWSVTAGLNNSSPPDGWPEGMARSAVNDCAREMMAALSKWYKDNSGSLVTAGTGNAYTLTTNSVYTALSDIPLLVFRTDRVNTGSVTLNVDGLGAKSLYKAGGLVNFGSGDLRDDTLVVAAYNSVAGAFETVGPSPGAFEVGTRMLFQSTAAPAGWTKEAGAGYDDNALRVVTGSVVNGGSLAFTDVFGDVTISTDQMPSHRHGSVVTGVASTINLQDTSGTVNPIETLTTGNTAFAGNGEPLEFDVLYTDVIIATKA